MEVQTATTRFKQERLTPLIDELQGILKRHWSEIAHYKDIPLEPNWNLYKKLDELGSLVVFTVRVDERLVGYAAYLIETDPHYSSLKKANQDVLYIDKDHRKGGLGSKLILWCDKQLKALGVKLVYQHVKCTHDFGPLLARLGYEKIETLWGRRLD